MRSLINSVDLRFPTGWSRPAPVSCLRGDAGQQGRAGQPLQIGLAPVQFEQETKGLAPLSEDEFESLGGDLSSISGSDSSEAEESLAVSAVREESECDSNWSTSATCGSPLVTFSSGNDRTLAVYRCVLTASKHADTDDKDMVELLRSLKTEQHWTILMEAGGHFAGAVFRGHKVLVHKTFHRYTVRAKRGTVQSVRDNQGGHCKSAGASLRRYNEAALEQDIQELLRSWSDLLAACSAVFLRSSKYNRKIFVGGKGATFEKGDRRLRTIPFATRRPTFNEVRRVQERLAVVFEGDNLMREEGGQDEEGVTAKGGREDTTTTMETRAECKTGRDMGSADSKVEGNVQKSTDGDTKHGLDAGTGEEFPLTQSQGEKAKGRRRKKKTPHAKEGSYAPETPCTEDAQIEEAQRAIEEAPHTEEASQTKEVPPVTEQVSDDMRELVQACKTGDVQHLTSMLNKMGLARVTEGDAEAMDESKGESGEMGETVGEPEEALEGRKPLESAGHSVPLDIAAEVSKRIEHSERGTLFQECSEARRKALLETAQEGRTLLHVAAQHGSANVITTLLLYGADPTIKDATGKTPYLVAQQKGARDALRRFVASHPGRWDWVAAQIPSPLTAEMEQAKREKAKARKKVKKENESKKRLQEEAAASQKQAVENLTDREKRALAAEKRLAKQFPSAPEVKRAGNCSYCKCSLAGIVPFEKFDFKYCRSTTTSATLQGRQPAQQAFVSDNHLMPATLRKIPEWFQVGAFQYNARFLVAMAPGALLISAVAGKLILAGAVLGVLSTLLLRSLGLHWMAMVTSVASVMGLGVCNVYCMFPLVWKSVLNFPLLMIFHFFICFLGMLWWLQDEEFGKQDPRFLLLVEKFLFCGFPMLSVVMVTWVSGMLFGRTVLPYAIAIVGLIAVSLFVVPLQSSFSKPGMPSGTIVPTAVALMYLTLEAVVPALVYAAFNTLLSFYHSMIFGLLVISPLFGMTLLESQGVFHWIGLGTKTVQLLRWATGGLVLLLVSVLLCTLQLPTYLPLFVVPIIFVKLVLVSSLEDSTSIFTSRWKLGIVSALTLLYLTAFLFLPWSISYNLSFFSMPLSLFQLLMLALSLCSLYMVVCWKQLTGNIWLLHTAVFVPFEYILIADEVYPVYLSLATGAFASVLFWRLHMCQRMSPSLAALNTCVHLGKLSLLIPPTSLHPSTLSLPLVPSIATTLILYPLLQTILFEPKRSISSPQLLVYSGLLLVGLFLSLDFILTPVLAAFTHRLPTTATLLAIICAVVGAFVQQSLSHERKPMDRHQSLLAPILLIVAMVLGMLQPEFSMEELTESLRLVWSSLQQYDVPEVVRLSAWSNLTVWVEVLCAFILLGVLATRRNKATVVCAATLLGVAIGLNSALTFSYTSPVSLVGITYGAVCGLLGVLLARAYVATTPGNALDQIVFAAIVLLSVLMYCMEWSNPNLKRMVPCTKTLMVEAIVLATAFRVKKYQQKDQSYLPSISNICCCVFFVLSLLSPIHPSFETSVVFASAIFLLVQPDGFIIPHTTSIFLPPSLLAALIGLYCSALSSPHFFEHFASTRWATVAEMVGLVAVIPGHFVFLRTLWKDNSIKMSTMIVLLLVAP
eukprot:Em0020g200a